MPNTEEAKQLVSLFRQKYPMYSDVSDNAVLQKLGSYELYKPVIEKEFSPPSTSQEFWKQAPETARSVLSEALGPAVETAKRTAQSVVPGQALTIPLNQVEKRGQDIFIQGPTGAARATAAGENPIGGLLVPETPPTIGKSIARAMRSYGVTDETVISRVSKNLGPILEQGTNILAFGLAPKAISEVSTILKESGVNHKLANELSSAIHSALLKGAKEPLPFAAPQNAVAQPPTATTPSLKTPLPLNSMNDVTTKSSQVYDKLKLGQISLAEAKKELGSSAISKMEKAVEPLSVEDRLGKIKLVHQNMLKEKFGPNELSKLPVEALEQVQTIEEQKFRQIASLKEVIRERAIKLVDQEFWADVYKNNTQIIEDVEKEISKRVNSHMGEEGFVAIPKFSEAVQNMAGYSEKVGFDFRNFAKTLGVPSMIGEKYPSFKPIYWAIQEGVDTSNAHFFDGSAILNPKMHYSLPETSKVKLAKIARLSWELGKQDGQMARLTEGELLEAGLTSLERDAYNSFLDTAQYVGKMEVERRKMYFDFDSMPPEEQAKFQQTLNTQVKRLGPGYFPTKRLRGDWIVFKEGAEDGSGYFFNIYKGKAEALKQANAIGVKPFLKTDFNIEMTKHISPSDLESLIDAAGINKSSLEVAELRKTIRARGFQSHWVKRDFKEGFPFTWDNLTEGMLDYLEGGSISYGKTFGKNLAEKAFKEGVEQMPSEIKAYARNFINTYQNGKESSAAAQGFARFIYGWKLALNVRNLVTNLTQPLATTWPEIARYYKGVEPEKVFIKSYSEAAEYVKQRVSRGAITHLPKDLIEIIDDFHRQNVLGERINRQMLGLRGMRGQQMDDFLGAFQSFGEAVNRTHSAIVAYKIGTEKLGLLSPRASDIVLSSAPDLVQKGVRVSYDALKLFMKQFIGKTQFLYGRQNMPLAIENAGTMRAPLKLAYLFRHYVNNYASFLANQTRSGNPGAITRAWGGLMAQAGLFGLPLASIAQIIYAKSTGHTAEDDLRRNMVEKGLPQPLQEAIMRGVYTGANMDMSASLGMGDAIPTYGSATENVIGAPAGVVRSVTKAVSQAERGEWTRALEEISPDVIKGVMRTKRVMQEGFTSANGTKLKDVTTSEAVLTFFNISPLSVSKAYAKKEAIGTIASTAHDKTSLLNQRAAKALYIDHNLSEYRAISKEARAAGVKLDFNTMKDWRDKYAGKKDKPAKSIQGEVRKTEKAFGT